MLLVIKKTIAIIKEYLIPDFSIIILKINLFSKDFVFNSDIKYDHSSEIEEWSFSYLALSQ